LSSPVWGAIFGGMRTGARTGRDEFGPIVTGQLALFRGVKWPRSRIGAASVRADHWPVTGRAARDALLVLTGLALAFLAWELATVLPRVLATPGAIGVDLHSYQDATRSWLAGDGFYPARQLAGPYAITGAESATGAAILYPPVSLLLFLPFTVLPEFLWYAIPLAAFGWAIWRLRPAMWSWPIIAAGIALPMNVDVVIRGNPAIWVAAAFATGCVITGPAVLVLLKPSLFPFALMGANRWRWWIALGLFAVISLPFGFMWLDWAHVVLNSNGSVLYSLRDALLLAIPLAALLSRTPAS